MSDLTLMTPEEHDDFFRDGYMVIRDVLSPAEAEDLRKTVAAIVDDAIAANQERHEPHYHNGSFKVDDALNRFPVFDALIDHPKVFGKLVSLIGDHIQLMGLELFVRGAADTQITGFHTDFGAAMGQILPTRENLMIQLKVQYFLTDLSTPDSSNFMLIPGSHMRRNTNHNVYSMIDDMNSEIAAGRAPEEVRQVLAKPGDVLIFPWTLWHAVAPNKSGNTRLSVTLRYGQLVLRPMEDFGAALGDSQRRFTPRQRRLLGDLGPVPSYWEPQDQSEIIAGRAAM